MSDSNWSFFPHQNLAVIILWEIQLFCFYLLTIIVAKNLYFALIPIREFRTFSDPWDRNSNLLGKKTRPHLLLEKCGSFNSSTLNFPLRDYLLKLQSWMTGRPSGFVLLYFMDIGCYCLWCKKLTFIYGAKGWKRKGRSLSLSWTSVDVKVSKSSIIASC